MSILASKPPERDAQRLGREVYQGVSKESAGYKLLASMGWSEGQGLGAQKQGIKEHVKVKKKHDATGVGALDGNVQSHSKNYIVGMVSFDKVLSGLREVSAVHCNHSDDDSSDDASSSSSSSESESESESDVKKKKSNNKRKQVAKNGKTFKSSPHAKRKNASSSDSSSSDESEASSSSDSSDSEAEAGTPRIKLATHLGRYQKRERGKMVKGYSTQDLAAILGVGEAKAAAEAEIKGTNEEEQLGHSAGNLGQNQGATGNDPHLDTEGLEPEPKAWWSYMFVRAGRMGSIKSELKSKHVHSHHGHGDKKKIAINGFSENDQESLYQQVQDAATHGKQGLGRSSMPKKVAGAHWKGTKTKIREEGESSNDDEMEGDDSSSSSSEDEDDGKVVVVACKKSQQVSSSAAAEEEDKNPTKDTKSKKDKKRKNGKVSEEEEEEEEEPAPKKAKKDKMKKEEKKDKKDKKDKKGSGDEEEKKEKKKKKKEKEGGKSKGDDKAGKKAKSAEDSGKPIKWHKVLVEILADAPKRRLTLVKLKKRALEAALAKEAAKHEEEEHMKEMMKKIHASPQRYNVCEKFVTLKE